MRSGSLLVLASLLASSPALAERPRGTYKWAEPDLVEIQAPSTPQNHASNTLYLNGCFEAGDCAFSPGSESSIENRSSIIDRSTTLSAFNAGPTAWDSLVECVKQTYAPFNIQVTDQDPGQVPHFEAVVAGYPSEVGMPQGVGGVAPFSCGVINNAVTYSFANIYGGYIPQICWTVAQESAHAFGLDHEFLCSDPMTYRSDCSDSKTFQDMDAPCGEFESRGCSCGGSTQNSYGRILSHFGPGSCEEDSDCGPANVCLSGHCVLGPGYAGGLGEECSSSGECASNLCGDDVCVEKCEEGPGACPDGFSCDSAGEFNVCVPGGGGGCQVAGGSGLAPLGLALFAVFGLLSRRRRRG